MLIKLFGYPQILINDRPVKGLQSKAFLLISLLFLKFNLSARRSVIASVLWEDRDTAHANANLRQLLAGIRKFEADFKINLIISDFESVQIAPGVMADLNLFLSNEPSRDSVSLRTFISSYSGEFLQGLEDSSAEQLRQWIVAERHELEFVFSGTVRDSASGIGGQFGAEALEHILSVHPYDEKTFQALILVYAKNQDFDSLRRRFQRFSTLLQKDLNATLSEESLDLLAQLCPDLIPSLQRTFFMPKIVYACDPDADPTLKIFAKSKNLPRILILPPTANGILVSEEIQKNAEGLVEDLTFCLCQMLSFVVLAPHTATHFAESKRSALSLDVDFSVTTRLASSMQTNRFGVKLVSEKSGEILISEEISLGPFTTYEIAKEFTNSIAIGIQKKIDREILSSMRHGPDNQAYSLYLHGKKLLNIDGLPYIRAARKMFIQSLNIFPEFYLAKQLLARTYHREWFLLGRPEKSLLHKARNFSEQLIGENPNTPGGYTELGISLLYLGDIDGGLQHTNTAARIAPQHADVLAQKAEILSHNGEHQQALHSIQSALSLNPIPPDIYYWSEAGSQFLIGEYEMALTAISKLKDLPASNLRLVAACHAMTGNNEKSAHFRDLHLQEYPDFKVDEWAKIYPAKNKLDVDHYIHALRVAGFT